MRMDWMVGCTAAAAMLLSALSAEATELKLATTVPAKTPWGAYIAAIAKKAEVKSSGELKIEAFYGGVLGDEQATMGQLSRGRIDMAMVSIQVSALLEPGLEVLLLPFLWKDNAEFDCAIDDHIGTMIHDMLLEQKVITLGYVEVPPYVLFAADPLRTPADISGKKWRAAPTKTSVAYLNATGANAIPLGNTDMTTSLKTGGVAGASTSSVFGIALGLHKLAPYVLVTHHTRVIGNVYVSQKAWKRLSPANQKILRELFADHSAIRATARGAEKAMLGKAAKAGATVVIPNAEELAQWKAIAETTYQPLIAEFGGRSKEVWNIVQKAKAACAS